MTKLRISNVENMSFDAFREFSLSALVGAS